MLYSLLVDTVGDREALDDALNGPEVVRSRARVAALLDAGGEVVG